jgi:hypothetical protein
MLPEATSPDLPDPKPSVDPPKSLAEAVVAIYETLRDYDELSQQRIIASVMSLLGTSAPSSHSTISSPTSSTSVSRRPLSPAELVHAKEPATNAQRIIVFAYYRERYENLNYFARDDLKAYFSKARLPIPANYERDFRDAIKQGWVYENGDESYLTSKGLEAVEAGFGGKAAPRGRSAKTKSSKVQKKESVPAE